MSRPIDTALMIDGRLEAIVTAVPEQAASDILLVCHPHPLHQGTMHNKVVTTLARMARDLGMPVLRFNFRGVMGSHGVWDEGSGEIDDALAALAWMREQYPTARVHLAGFSFGAYVAAHAASRSNVAGLMLVAPATSRFDMASVQVQVPTFVAFNWDDDTVEPESMSQWLSAQPQSLVTSYLQADGGHFNHGQLTALKRAAQDWLKEQI